jgi:hypothetical protein
LTISFYDASNSLIEESTDSVIININNQPPELVDQVFCGIESPTIADLIPSGLTWYASANTFTTPLDPSTPLTTQYYFATQTLDGCESSTSFCFVEIINEFPPFISRTTQGFCTSDNPTITDLQPSNLIWYEFPNGGSQLAQDFPLSNTTYYASDTDPFLGCESENRTAVNVVLDDAAFEYPLTEYCNFYNNPTPINVLIQSGVFTIDNGGIINASSGEIDLSNSYLGTNLSGNFTVIYTTSCASALYDITIIANADLSYANTYSLSGENPIPLSFSPVGGIFTIDNGGTINSVTGEIDITSLVDGGNYGITYTTQDACSSTVIYFISIVASPITYPNDTVAINGVNPVPTILIPGGIFSINNGATISTATGEVDLSSTMFGTTYTITYTYENTRVSSYTFDLTVVETLNADNQLLDANIDLFPNPTTTNFILRNKSSYQLERLDIINYLGTLVKSIDLKSMTSEKLISVTELSSGVYFVKIKSDKSSVTKKLILK